jgi:hypothetical protein
MRAELHSQKPRAQREACVEPLCAGGACRESHAASPPPFPRERRWVLGRIEPGRRHEKHPPILPAGWFGGANFTGQALLGSSSPYAGNGNNAWNVNFNNGNDNTNNKNNALSVRLVRSGVWHE